MALRRILWQTRASKIQKWKKNLTYDCTYFATVVWRDWFRILT